jgi:hypothetical protein
MSSESVSLEIKTLDQIFLENATDKASSYHNYSIIYEQLFNNKRDKNGKLLEIGVFNGASLKSWKEYFSNFIIYGVDIDTNCKSFETDRINITITNAGKPFTMSEFGKKNGPFDIVIDDGSHRANDIITTYYQLIKFIKPGGYYIIEDLHCNDVSYNYNDYMLLKSFITEECSNLATERNKIIKKFTVVEKMIIVEKA